MSKQSNESSLLQKKRLSMNHYQEVLDQAFNTLDTYIDDEIAKQRKRAHILLTDASGRQVDT